VPPRKLTPAEERRKAATVKRVKEEIAHAMQSARRKSSSVDYDRVDHCVETYLQCIPLVKQWKEEGRIIKYRDIEELICHVWLRRDPDPISRQSASRKAARKIAQSKTLTNWLKDKHLSAHVRGLAEQLRTGARRDAAVSRRFLQKDVPKDPQTYLAVAAAEWLLMTIRPYGQPVEPIAITAWKGKEQSTDDPQSYSALVRIATALRFDQPVVRKNCREMLKACEKLCELRNIDIRFQGYD
jgi:hypothetical protein